MPFDVQLGPFCDLRDLNIAAVLTEAVKQHLFGEVSLLLLATVTVLPDVGLAGATFLVDSGLQHGLAESEISAMWMRAFLFRVTLSGVGRQISSQPSRS